MKKRKNNFSNKLHYTLAIILAILIFGVGVYAIQTSPPGSDPSPGHTLATIAPPSGCSDGQFLQYDFGSGGHTWVCANPPSGGTNYWTDSGAFVEPTSGDKVGATQYCDESGVNCFEASAVSGYLQCPPELVPVRESSPGNDEFARNRGCIYGVGGDGTPYVRLSTPEICDGTDCESIKSGYADDFCEAYGLNDYNTGTLNPGSVANTGYYYSTSGAIHQWATVANLQSTYSYIYCSK